jgi:hypothetical protein
MEEMVRSKVRRDSGFPDRAGDPELAWRIVNPSIARV